MTTKRGRPAVSEFGKQIANGKLAIADIPSPDADWDAIWQFALTFDGYLYWGSTEKCAEIANAHADKNLADLRTCLFFEQRRWRHFGKDPDKKAMVYIRQILEAIRIRVASGNSC